MTQGWDDSSWSPGSPAPGGVAGAPAGSAPGTVDGVERPPLPWLVAGLAVAGIAIVLGVLAVTGRSLLLGGLGWVLAGPLAIGLLAGFVSADGNRRQRAWYVPGSTAAWLRRALVVAALVGVALAGWAIADVVARW